MTAAASGDFWLNGWGTPLNDDITETWTGTNGAAWGSQWTAQVGSTIQSNTGQLVTAATAYTGAQAYHTPGLLDGDLTVRTQVTGTTERYHTVYFRHTSAGNSGYAVTLYPNGFDLKRYDSGGQTTLSTTAVTLTAAWYKIRVQWQGNLLRAKVWLDNAAEPGSWMVTATDDTYGIPGALQLQVVSGGTATAITGAFDDLAVHDLNTSPAITPTQVLGMTATSGPGAVTIRWTPQTGAAGYNIYRGGTLIGTAPVQSQKVYTDSTGTVGTSYSYTVSAYNTAGEGPQSASASATASTYTAWSAWTTARDARATANTEILFVGDSITEGQGASTKANRWQDLVVGKIRTAYPTTGAPGSDGYLPAFYGTYAPDSPWQSATTVAPGQWIDTKGALGYRSTIEPAAGASTTFTVFGTAIDIWSAGPGGTMTYQVDGGTVNSVNQAAHTAATKTRVTFGGAAASHTVIIDCTAGTTSLGGWTVFNGDETIGIVPYDSARSGYRTSHFVAATAADYAGQILAWKAVAPDLVFLGLGINDYTNAVTVAQIKANLLEIIDAFKQFPKVPNIVLVGVYEFNGFTASNGDTWAGYINMLKAIQTADPAVVAGVADLYADMGTSSSGGFWSSDALHPSDTGHAHMADTIYAVLPSAPAGGSGTASLAVTVGVSTVGSIGIAASASAPVTASTVVAGTVGKSTAASVPVTASITASGVVGLSSAAALAVTETTTSAGTAGLSASGTVPITATVIASGSASRAVGAALATVASTTSSGTLGVASGSAVATTAAVTAAGSVALTGSGSVATTATAAASGIVGKAGAATIATTEATSVTGVVGLSTSAAVAVTVGTAASGSAALSGTAATTTTVTTTSAGVVGLSGVAAVATTASVVASGIVGLSSGVAVAVTAGVSDAGSANLSKAAVLAVTATVSTNGSAVLTQTSTVPIAAVTSATGNVATSSGAAVAITAGIAGGGTASRTGAASSAVTVTVTATGVITSGLSGTAAVATAATIVAAGSVATSSGVVVATTVGVTPGPVVGRSATGSVPVVAAVVATGSASRASAATFVTAASVVAAGVVGTSTSTTVATTAFVGAVGSAGLASGAGVAIGATVAVVGVVTAGLAGSTSRDTTVTIASTGQVGTTSSASLVVAAAITGAGVAASSQAAAVAITASVAATGRRGVGTGSTVGVIATVTAAGMVGQPGGITVPTAVLVTASGQVSVTGTAAVPVTAGVVAAGDVQITTPPASKGITFTLVATGVVGASSGADVVISTGIEVVGKLSGGMVAVPIAATVITSGTVATSSGVVVAIDVGLRLDGVIRGLSLYHGPRITVGMPEDSPLGVGPARRPLVGVGGGSAGNFGASAAVATGPTIGGPRRPRTVGKPNDANRG